MSSVYHSTGLVETRELPAARIERTGDRQVDQLQANIARSLEPVMSLPLLGANLFLDVPFVSGAATVIEHHLGRKFLECNVCPPSGVVARFRRVAQVPAELDESQVTLIADATTVASVLVF